jgi:hypothetical protein
MSPLLQKDALELHKIMKKLLAIIVLGLALNSCGDGGSAYDKGYNDGYDGASPRKSSGSYFSGYEDGQFDADCDYYRDKNMWAKYKSLRCG